MFKNEIRQEIKNIDSNFIDLKVAIHNLEKLGFNVNDLYKAIENLGIEIYKFKIEKVGR